jgi:hypothetical protein
MKLTAKPCEQGLALGFPAKAEPGGANRDRTGDLLLAKQALSQLSYGPGPRSGEDLWWVWVDLNHRPPPYQDGALTN